MQPVYSTNYYVEIGLFTIIAITCLSFLIIQIMFIKEKYKNKPIRSVQKTLISSTIVHLSFFLMACVALFNHIYSSNTCICPHISHLVSLFYDIGKWNMWYFFVCWCEWMAFSCDLILVQWFFSIFLVGSNMNEFPHSFTWICVMSWNMKSI